MIARVVRMKCDDCVGEGVGPDDQPCTSCDGEGSVPSLEERDDVVPEPAPITRRLLGGDFDDCENVPCMVCGRDVPWPRHIVDFVRERNRDEQAKADATAHDPYPYRPHLVARNQIGTCPGECTVHHREAITRESEKDWQTTDGYLRDLKQGKLSPVGAKWLREQRFGDAVDAYYRKQVEDEKKEELRKAREARKAAK